MVRLRPGGEIFHRFVSRVTFGVFLPRDFVKPKIVMLDDPFAFDIASTLMAGDFSLRHPFPRKTI
jgi:hypothetical protein